MKYTPTAGNLFAVIDGTLKTARKGGWIHSPHDWKLVDGRLVVAGIACRPLSGGRWEFPHAGGCNVIALNVGLDSARLGHVPAHTAQGLLALLGFTIHASRVVTGEWEGKPESTLALLVSPPCEAASPSCRAVARAKLQAAARQLGQECIAVQWAEGNGELVPPCAYSFRADLFHDPVPV